MIHYSKIIAGFQAYISSEIIAQVDGSIKGWGVAIATGIVARRAVQIFDAVKNHPMLTALGLVDGEMIDIDIIYAEALKAAQHESATINIPVLGPVTFKAADVESLYRHITGV